MEESLFSRETHERRQGQKPASIGYYDFEKNIGAGNFAKVKLATHSLTKEKVAVKIIDKAKLDKATSKKLFREVRIMKLLSHPHIVRLYEVIDTPKELFLILEYVPGGEIFDFLVSKGRMKEKDARKYFRQIVGAVDYCHNMRIIHRDLKAENLLLDANLNVKIADFGFSNQFEPGQRLSTWCGSPPYAAPELFQGKEYNGPEVDIWSLGVVLYVLVCGALPFDGPNLTKLRARVLTGKFKVPFYMSTDCEKFIKKMLVLDSSKRATMIEMKEDKWFNLNIEEEPTINVRLGTVILTPEEEANAFSMCTEIGLDVDAVKKSLVDNNYDYLAATYFLAIEKILKRREQLSSSPPNTTLETNLNAPTTSSSSSPSPPLADNVTPTNTTTTITTTAATTSDVTKNQKSITTNSTSIPTPSLTNNIPSTVTTEFNDNTSKSISPSSVSINNNNNHNTNTNRDTQPSRPASSSSTHPQNDDILKPTGSGIVNAAAIEQVRLSRSNVTSRKRAVTVNAPINISVLKNAIASQSALAQQHSLSEEANPANNTVDNTNSNVGATTVYTQQAPMLPQVSSSGLNLPNNSPGKTVPHGGLIPMRRHLDSTSSSTTRQRPVSYAGSSPSNKESNGLTPSGSSTIIDPITGEQRAASTPKANDLVHEETKSITPSNHHDNNINSTLPTSHIPRARAVTIDPTLTRDVQQDRTTSPLSATPTSDATSTKPGVSTSQSLAQALRVRLSMSVKRIGSPMISSTNSSIESTEVAMPAPPEPRSLRYSFNVFTTSSKPIPDIMATITRALTEMNIEHEVNCFVVTCCAEEVNFEVEVCKLSRLSMNGVRLKRLGGNSWNYKKICTEFVQKLEL